MQRIGPTGQLKLEGIRWKISKPLAGQRVHLVRKDHRVLVFYCRTLIRELDLASQGSTAVEPWLARTPL